MGPGRPYAAPQARGPQGPVPAAQPAVVQTAVPRQERLWFVVVCLWPGWEQESPWLAAWQAVPTVAARPQGLAGPAKEPARRAQRARAEMKGQWTRAARMKQPSPVPAAVLRSAVMPWVAPQRKERPLVRVRLLLAVRPEAGNPVLLPRAARPAVE